MRIEDMDLTRHVVEDEPTAKVTVTHLPVLPLPAVDDCDVCPFVRNDESCARCAIAPDDKSAGGRLIYVYSDEPCAFLPPSWCPLRRGVAVVELSARVA